MDQILRVLKNVVKELSNALRSFDRETKAQRDADVLTMQIKGLTAKARVTPEGFIVLRGSQAVSAERPSMRVKPFAQSRRNYLISNNVMQKKRNCFVFTQDVAFRSPTAAGEVIQAGTAQGPALWRNSSGKTLKDLGWGRKGKR
jgi:hypothetical protein